MKSILFLALLLVACDVEPVSERRFEKNASPERDMPVLRAADFVGYDGDRLRKSTSTLIDANRKRNQAIEDALKSTK
jgi:hypothetical protein